MQFLALTATLLVSAATVAASTTTSATSMGNATAPTAATSTGTAVSSPTRGLKAGERCKAGTFRCGGNDTSSWIEVCNMDHRWYPAKEWMCGGPGCCFSQGSRLCCGCMGGAVDCPVAAGTQVTEGR
ncbi:hypothetical protein GGTG_04409 [Gaeumannomyces tritici R3-111a-1]|uniref:Uncharacterized protein n=1 Tax=Gaeumannomyces tritici (strain R3-111a-1) TaxID=644352 RepID=J3NT11_GAET3|nr:hypothetical protein GGTG_04409 [Gaeumannomyces tritici R3-111a-1]EJT79324.1 hypothetical protein GGTG_04409 [Gaeumannomyces tritici R3-111a-1]